MFRHPGLTLDTFLSHTRQVLGHLMLYRMVPLAHTRRPILFRVRYSGPYTFPRILSEVLVASANWNEIDPNHHLRSLGRGEGIYEKIMFLLWKHTVTDPFFKL